MWFPTIHLMDWFRVWYNSQVVHINNHFMNPYTFYGLIQWVRSPRAGGNDSFTMWTVRRHCHLEVISNSNHKPLQTKKTKELVKGEMVQFHKNNNTTLFPTHDGNHSLKKTKEVFLRDLPHDHPRGMLLAREGILFC